MWRATPGRARTNYLDRAPARMRAMRRARIADRWHVRVFGSRLAHRAFAALVTLMLCLLVTLFVQAQQAGLGIRDSGFDPPEGQTAFVCPMHPDYTLDIAGTCP